MIGWILYALCAIFLFVKAIICGESKLAIAVAITACAVPLIMWGGTLLVKLLKPFIPWT